jgi:regulator of protease activity HflC (stomatin/prohibitin superfamily)
MTPTNSPSHHEKPIDVANGWPRLFLNIAMVLGGPVMWISGIVNLADRNYNLGWLLLIVGIPTMILGIIFLIGHFTLQPNEGRVLILFGEYRGTVRKSGFFWTNPFYTKRKISLRTRDFESYVDIQAESAIRHLASNYAYDQGEEDEITLRGGGDEISSELQKELQVRLDRAGVEVEEARITHLAYAPEIAQAMLRRQQAEAVIAARRKIVEGAVSMVEMALKELANKNVLTLDDERRAAMVTNLLVVLCGESEATPVINTGTLYH